MTQVIGVRFKKVGKVYYFDPDGITVKPGEHVIVETARGVEYGEVVMGNREVADDKVVQPLKKLLRAATPQDEKKLTENRRREKEAMDICRRKIAEHKLEMKLIDVEYTFDNNKILFYFTADGRVDFRDLVKDLASVFRTRIELRQIGVRDEAKMIGGLGICGKPFCCSTFLGEFHPVSIKMAKDQGLSLNPTKISGTCGRLMCCLKYEQNAYDELLKATPKNGAPVDTPEGRGMVISTNLLRGQATVRMNAAPDATPKTFSVKELRVQRSDGTFPEPEPREEIEDPELLMELERAERSEQTERVQRPERPGRPDQPQRPDRLDRQEKPERPDRPDRPERREFGPKQDRPPRPDQQQDKPPRPPRPDRQRHRPRRGGNGGGNNGNNGNSANGGNNGNNGGRPQQRHENQGPGQGEKN